MEINIKKNIIEPPSDRSVDAELIAALEADEKIKHNMLNSEKTPEENQMKIGSKQHVSLRFGVVGSGQAGGRMAEVFHRFGYDACAINTAKQDLDTLSIPESRRMLIEYTISGSGKDIEIGLLYRDWETDRKSTRLNSSHSRASRMPSSA